MCLFLCAGGRSGVAKSLEVGIKGKFRLRVEGYRIRNQASYHENRLEGLFQDLYYSDWLIF